MRYDIECKILGCDRKVMYKKDNVCQKHYFRFMRSGAYELTRSRKYRIQNPAGYQKLYEPLHILSNNDGYVYEHRFVFFNEINNTPKKCELCNRKINWKDLHIDHKDNDVTNNNKNNLRALCRACNTFRGHTDESMGKKFIECRGLKLTASQWARRDDVKIASNTITIRLAKGQSVEQAIFGERLTHQNTRTKVIKTKYLK